MKIWLALLAVAFSSPGFCADCDQLETGIQDLTQKIDAANSQTAQIGSTSGKLEPQSEAHINYSEAYSAWLNHVTRLVSQRDLLQLRFNRDCKQPKT